MGSNSAQLSWSHASLTREPMAAEERARHFAECDLLTDLPNRARTLRQLKQLMQSGTAAREKIGLLYVDLDGFNNVNDSMGHEAGDHLLKTVALRMRGLLRHMDILARVGADEFIVVLPELRNPADAAGVAHVLLDAIRKPVTLNDRQVSVTASVGIGIAPCDATNGDELVRNAVAAMHAARQSGPGSYRHCAPSINAAAACNLKLENELRRALECEQLVLHYQPQVDLGSGAVIGAEALVRWNRTGVGLVPPGEFLPIAAERGLMVPVGRWVLREAIRQMKIWTLLGLPIGRVAVNLTDAELHRPGFVAELSSLLADHELEASRLEFELTAGTALRHFDRTCACLDALRALGAGLSLDDVGPGYSALRSLHRLPVDRVKIDQAFIRGLTPQSDSIRTVRAIIGLAHSFSLRVIAEGVETRNQAALLAAEGCDEIQGFAASRALPALQLQRVLQGWRHQDHAVSSRTARGAGAA